MNLGVLTSLAAGFAEDPQQSRYAGLYTQAANLAQQQFALDSKALWKDQSITVVGGTAAYALATDFMWEKKVKYKGLKLDPITRSELELVKRSSDWTLDAGTPQNFIIDPEDAAKTITLYPFPPTGDAGGTLVLTYFPLPADMVNPTDNPLNAYTLLAQFHIGLAAWMAWLLLGNDVATPEKGAKRQAMLQLYNDAVSTAVDTVGNTISEPPRMRGVRGQGNRGNTR